MRASCLVHNERRRRSRIVMCSISSFSYKSFIRFGTGGAVAAAVGPFILYKCVKFLVLCVCNGGSAVKQAFFPFFPFISNFLRLNFRWGAPEKKFSVERWGEWMVESERAGEKERDVACSISYCAYVVRRPRWWWALWNTSIIPTKQNRAVEFVIVDNHKIRNIFLTASILCLCLCKAHPVCSVSVLAVFTQRRRIQRWILYTHYNYQSPNIHLVFHRTRGAPPRVWCGGSAPALCGWY